MGPPSKESPTSRYSTSNFSLIPISFQDDVNEASMQQQGNKEYSISLNLNYTIQKQKSPPPPGAKGVEGFFNPRAFAPRNLTAYLVQQAWSLRHSRGRNHH